MTAAASTDFKEDAARRGRDTFAGVADRMIPFQIDLRVCEWPGFSPAQIEGI
jgi:hypothetical protein